MTEAMDQPPIDLDVVDTADVIEPYKKMINLFKEQVFQASAGDRPQSGHRRGGRPAQARSPPTSARSSRATSAATSPTFEAALKKLSDANEADREQAITAAKCVGAERVDGRLRLHATGRRAPTTPTRSSSVGSAAPAGSGGERAFRRGEVDDQPRTATVPPRRECRSRPEAKPSPEGMTG